jgi:hypothetical protein
MDVAAKVRAVALLTLLPFSSSAGKNKIEGLAFQPAQVAGSPKCFDPMFSIEQEPDTFFKGLKHAKNHGVVTFRRGNSVVENFPDELRLKVLFVRRRTEFGSCAVEGAFDPARIKFRAEWKSGSRSQAAEGVIVQSEWQNPGPWCEDHCDGYWIYELRINSAGVALTNQLFVAVNAEDGTRLEQLVGTLGPAQPVIIPELVP